MYIENRNGVIPHGQVVMLSAWDHECSQFEFQQKPSLLNKIFEYYHFGNVKFWQQKIHDILCAMETPHRHRGSKPQPLCYKAVRATNLPLVCCSVEMSWWKIYLADSFCQHYSALWCGPIRKNAQYIQEKLGWVYKRSDGAGSDSVVLWFVQAPSLRCELSSIPGVSNEWFPVSSSQNWVRKKKILKTEIFLKIWNLLVFRILKKSIWWFQ